MTWLARRVDEARASDPTLPALVICEGCGDGKRPEQFAGERCWSCEAKVPAPYIGPERRSHPR